MFFVLSMEMWGVTTLFLVMLFFEILGGELCWHSHILPRLEKTHNKLN
jgi:hypothetical protein